MKTNYHKGTIKYFKLRNNTDPKPQRGKGSTDKIFKSIKKKYRTLIKRLAK